jgi:hypothetical protein
LWRCSCLIFLACLLLLGSASSAAGRPRVAALQVALRAHGLYAGAIDAVYGPATARGLRRFQRGNGLAVDGRIGPATRSALGELGRHGFGSRVLSVGALGWDVSVVQFLLARDGAILSIDGHFGPRTAAALRKFQRVHKLVVDGIAGRTTFAALLEARPRHIVSNRSTTRSSRVPTLIDHWAVHYGVDRALMRAVAWMESGYQANLISSVGAQGVMQILPATWGYVEDVLLGRKVPHTVSGNIRVGVVFMRQLLREFTGNSRSALAAWYQGPASLRRHGPFRVTKRFVADVVALRQLFALGDVAGKASAD